MCFLGQSKFRILGVRLDESGWVINRSHYLIDFFHIRIYKSLVCSGNNKSTNKRHKHNKSQ